MKKKINLIVVSAMFLAGGCATIHKIDSTKLEVIKASEIISDSGKTTEITNQVSNEGKELVILFKKGDSFPVKIDMLFPVAKLETKPNKLIFSQDTYLYVARSKMRISPDGQRWADIYDFESQKKLFGFDKGLFSVGFGMSKEDGPAITLGVEAK